MALESDYLFVIDAEARLDDAQTLRELLKQNRYELRFLFELRIKPVCFWFIIVQDIHSTDAETT